MPIVKPIAGHTRCANVMRYLTKKDRALACDYLNIDAPIIGYADGLPTYGDVDWAAVMDSTRHRHGNDEPWRGKRVRTYVHYVVSPDPKDAITLPALRGLATDWAQKHFPDHEVAVVYHDDNAGGIPHAHLVVNNTNLETGRRLQVPDPLALNRSMQRMAAERGLSALDNVERATAPPRRERDGAREGRRHPPRTLQRVHRSRVEAELSDAGRYSWVADIRARVEVARAAAASEHDFIAELARLGVTVSENSPKARRRDWLYALSDRPARRVSGEKLGLLYSRESLERRFAYGPRLAESDRDRIAEIARDAVEVGDLAGLRALAGAVALVDEKGVRSVADLDRLEAAGEVDAASPAARLAREAGFLPASAPRRARAAPGRPPESARASPWNERQQWQRESRQPPNRRQGGPSSRGVR